MRICLLLTVVAYGLVSIGCNCHKKPHITAVSLNNDCHYGQETGIPFYLPKPLLIVSKNFRNIEEAKVGLTDTAPIPTGYDDQSKYADVNARTNFNFDGNGGGGGDSSSSAETNTGTSFKSGQHLHSTGAPVTPFKSPSDGLGPDTFYTYHIVFVPDLTQKYGLRITGGPGEIRAAMNLVNGWQYTGMGPYYAKDSSTAQNILSAGITARLGGQAAQDVLSGVANLTGGGGVQSGGQFDASDSRIQSLSETISQLPDNAQPMVIPAFAEIHVYEPSLGPDGMMTWTEIANCVFNREYLGVKKTEVEYAPAGNSLQSLGNQGGQSQSGGQFQNGNQSEMNSSVAKSAIASIFGVSPQSPAIQSGDTLQSGGQFDSASGGGVTNITVNCDDHCDEPLVKASSAPPLFSHARKLFGKHKAKPKIQLREVSLPPSAADMLPNMGILPNPTESIPNQLNDPALSGGN